MPEIITATYRIVTPMFIGGADQTPSDGIRPPSVKGMLRFWWRALNWGDFWKDANGNKSSALRALHKEEAHLFGAAIDDKKKTGGQGCFLLSVSSENLQTTDVGMVHQQFNQNDAARYLGYGLMEAFSSRPRNVEAGQLVRSCINENQSFSVQLFFRESIKPSIKETLVAWGLLGGLGSRSRHGLGSVTLEKIEKNKEVIWEQAKNKEDYNAQVESILKNKLLALNPSPYSAFDDKSRVDILANTNNPYRALNQFASAQLMYRSWGKNGQVLQKPSERNFPDDHDWKYRNQPERRFKHQSLPANFHPKRVVFGLPHNYGQGSHLSVTSEKQERRSSPLLLHIHQLSNTNFLTVMTYFPTLFLPNGEKINAGGRRVPANIQYSIITDFLDNADKQGRPRFPKKETVIKGARA